jgi:hypothetical protein
MVEHVSAVLACIDLAIRTGNAAAQHVLTMRSNKSTLADLLRHFGDLRGALYSMRTDPKLNTAIWRDILESMRAYFEQAREALAKMSGARRAFAPRQVAGTLNGLVRDLQHVESLLLGLDGFDNVGRLLTDIGVVLRDNEAALAGIDEEVKGVASTVRLVQGDIRHVLGVQERVLEVLTSMVDSQAVRNVRLDDVVETVRAACRSRPADGTPAKLARSTCSTELATGDESPGADLHAQPTTGASVLDYDSMNVRFSMVDPKLDRFLNAVQKGGVRLPSRRTRFLLYFGRCFSRGRLILRK